MYPPAIMTSPDLRADQPLDPQRAAPGAETSRAEPPPKPKKQKSRRRFSALRWFFSLVAAVLLARALSRRGLRWAPLATLGVPGVVLALVLLSWLWRR